MRPSCMRAGQMAAAGIFAVFFTGCQSPLDSPGPRALGPDVARAIERELAELAVSPPPPLPTGRSAVEEELASRRDELDALGPATATSRTPFGLGDDLTGREQSMVAIDRVTTILAAVENNLDIRIAQLQPGIDRQDVLSAEAAFDFVLFSNIDHTKLDEPSTVPVLNNIPLGTPFQASESTRFDTGVRKTFRSGGEATVSTDLTRFRNNAPGIALNPDPAYTGAIRLGYTQPLLRGFGEDVNTASIRVAANAQQRAVELLRQELLALVAETESAYWDLVFAWQDLEIRQWLVDVGIEVRDQLQKRRILDATDAQRADAIARIEQRRADVIRGRRAVRQASDRLKALMNDDDLTIGSEVVLEPSDPFMETAMSFSLRDALINAFEERPELRVALLGVDDRTIAEEVADNARLPVVDLSAEIAYLGLDDDAGSAYSNALGDEFIDYIFGLKFEWPIGNRAAEAGYRKSRLQRAQAMLEYQTAVRTVALDVKTALRDTTTNYELIEATRSFRIAQAENLRTLQVEEANMRGLTPEFLNLKFQRQETLASSRQQELQAVAEFDRALARLARAMGSGLTQYDITLEIDSPEDAAGARVP